jgi:hypothetical protein
MSTKLHVRDDSFTVQPPLSQAVGYIVVVLIGIIIALGMIPQNSTIPQSGADKRIVMMLVTKILKKTTGEDNKKTEMYNPSRSSCYAS